MPEGSALGGDGLVPARDHGAREGKLAALTATGGVITSAGVLRAVSG